MSKKKPESVDAEAWWSSSDNEWVLGPKDDEGEFHGVVTYWRPDGTLVNHCKFEHGTPHGEYTRYHESGKVSRHGRFMLGSLNGTDVFTRSDEETTENFPQGLNDKVWRAEMDMVDDSMTAGRLYNREGKQVGEDGSLCPDRPKQVPAEAVYSSTSGRWVLGKTDDSYKRAGIWRFYTQEGWVQQSIVYNAGDIKSDTRYRNRYESQATTSLADKNYKACAEAVVAGTNELKDDVDLLLLSWIQVQCLSEQGDPDKAFSLAIESLEKYPIGHHWGRFMPQGQRGFNTTAQVLAFIAKEHVREKRGEQALVCVLDAIANSTRDEARFYVIKASALHLLGREDEEFSSIKTALSIDSTIEELKDYSKDPKFADWLKAIDPESMTVEGAWRILGDAGEKLGQYQGVLAREEDDDEDEEDDDEKDEQEERVVFNPDEMESCLDHPWDLSSLPETNPELSAFAKIESKLDICSYRGEYSSACESTLSAAILTNDGNWLARIQSIFLPASQVSIDDESMLLASWKATEHQTSRIYSIHQDEAEFYHRTESISAMVIGQLELDEEDHEITISERQKNQWHKAASLTGEYEAFDQHLELQLLEARTHWIVNLVVGKNPDIISEIFLGEGIQTAASPEDWKREKQFLAWPHLQAYWLFHHAVFGDNDGLREVLEVANRSYPGVAELSAFAAKLLADEEISEQFWNSDRVLEYRLQAMEKRAELMSESATARVLEENKAIFEADAKVDAAFDRLRENPKNEGLMGYLGGLNQFGGSLDGVQEAIARQMDKPMDYYMSMKKGRVTPFEEFFAKMDVFPERIEEIPEREQPLLDLFEAAIERGTQSPDDHSKVMAGSLYGLGVLTINDASGFDSFLAKVKSLAFYPDKFGRFRRLEVAMLAAKYISESDAAKGFLQEESARFAEQAEDWKSDTFDFADRTLTASGDDAQLNALNERLCNAHFSGTNWTESIAICQRFLENPSPLMASGLKAAVDKGLGRHDDGQRATVVRAYAKCAAEGARPVLLDWLENIKDVRSDCERAALLAGLIEVDIGTDALSGTLEIARGVLGKLNSGSMKVGAAVSLMRAIFEHKIPGFASIAKTVNKNAQKEKYVKDRLKEWLAESVEDFVE